MMKTNNIPKKSNWGGKLTKRIIGMVLSIAMLASVGTTVMAEDVGSDTDYVVTYSAKEITDAGTVFAMAASGQFDTIETALQGNFKMPRNVSTMVITEDNNTVYQVLEKRQYTNGNVETSIVATTLAAKDLRSISYESVVHSGSGSGNNTYVTCKSYCTQRYESDGLYTRTAVLVNRVSTTVNSKLGSDSVWFRQICNIHKEMGVKDWSSFQDTYSPTLNYEYFLYPSGSPEYVYADDANGQIRSGCQVYVNGQFSFEAMIDII